VAAKANARIAVDMRTMDMTLPSWRESRIPWDGTSYPMNSGPVLADAMLPAGQRVACDAPASHRTKTFAPIRAPRKDRDNGTVCVGQASVRKTNGF
jgi:hypothetical protein